MTGFEIVRVALKTIGVLAPEDPLPPADATDGLAALNRMVSMWNNMRMALYAILPYDFDLSASTGTYTVGPTGDFVTPSRPLSLEACGLISYQNPLQPLELPLEVLTLQDWRLTPVKSVESAMPTQVYFEPYNPNVARVHFYPVPNGSLTLKARLYLSLLFAGFSNGTTNYTFPDGYEMALTMNLAKILAPEYRRKLDPVTLELAVTSLALIKRSNAENKLDELEFDRALIGAPQYFNWITGQ